MKRVISLSANSLGWILLSSLLSTSLAAKGLSEGGEWLYVLYMGGSRVGTSRVVSTMVSEERLETTNNIRFMLTRGAQNLEVSLNARTVYRWPEGRPLNYEMTFVGGRVPTLITGNFSENESTIRVKTGPQEFTKQIPLEGDEYVLDNNFLLDHYLVMLASIPLDKGSEVHFVVPQLVQQFPRVFGMRLKPRGVQRFVVGAEVWEGLKIESVGDTGLRMDFWIDPKDRTLLRWTVPSQVTEVVLSRGDGGPAEAADLNSINAAPLERYYIPVYLEMGGFREVESLKLRLNLCVFSDEATADSEWQIFTGEIEKRGAFTCFGGTVSSEMVIYDGTESVPRLRHNGQGDSTYIQSTPEIPANNDEIAEAAKEIIGDTKDRWKAANLVGAWMAENIGYEITGAGALSCLKTRKGDCGPQSLLALSMLRSLGVPSRLVGGLLYIGGKFGQHNWVEVEVSQGRWIPFDPTTGELGRFSASHIKLWQGLGTLAPDARPMTLEVFSFTRSE